KDGTFSYSNIRKINFSSFVFDVMLYPNPVLNARVTLVSSGNINSAILFDAAGKTIRTFVLQGTNNVLDVSGIAKGVYQLKVFGGNTIHNSKLVIQ
ncbi:MAG: T9SS type A sorting domain-containing protein, partial [Chitinophagaceae bacterium]|nr:T9SS type A sorting domain-containing protein [Chitinophagaceae bacterium]